MDMIYKAARLEKEAAGALELALINEQTLAFQIVPLNIGDTVNQDRRGNFLDPEA